MSHDSRRPSCSVVVIKVLYKASGTRSSSSIQVKAHATRSLPDVHLPASDCVVDRAAGTHSACKPFMMSRQSLVLILNLVLCLPSRLPVVKGRWPLQQVACTCNDQRLSVALTHPCASRRAQGRCPTNFPRSHPCWLEHKQCSVHLEGRQVQQHWSALRIGHEHLQLDWSALSSPATT